MIAGKLTDFEKEEIVEKCKNMLFEAGFDNVAILANEGGTNGTIRTSSRTRPALFRLLLATVFMDDCISKMLKQDSDGKKYGMLSAAVFWKPSLPRFGRWKMR